MKEWLARVGREGLGWLLVAIGIPMMPLPGPGIVVLVAGLTILSQRYVWARRLAHPLMRRATHAARLAVSSPVHIAFGMLGGVWIFALGIVWIVGPRIPEFDLLVLHVGPQLPGQGWVVGLGLIASAFGAWSVLAWSLRRFGRRGPGLATSSGPGAA